MYQVEMECTEHMLRCVGAPIMNKELFLSEGGQGLVTMRRISEKWRNSVNPIIIKQKLSRPEEGE